MGCLRQKVFVCVQVGTVDSNEDLEVEVHLHIGEAGLGGRLVKDTVAEAKDRHRYYYREHKVDGAMPNPAHLLRLIACFFIEPPEKHNTDIER